MTTLLNTLKISAVIPAYNCQTYISRAIESILAQSRPVHEIIVVDDGSRDHTAERVRDYSERVRYIYQDNAGASAARNRGIQAAEGEWIAFLDSDDEWLPDRLERQAEVLARHPRLRWCAGNATICYCPEERRGPQLPVQQVNRVLKGRDYFENYFLASRLGLIGNMDTMLIRRDVLLETGCFRTELSSAEDLDLWWRIAYRCPAIGYVNQPLAIYHLGVPASLSQSFVAAEHIIKLIDRHLNLSETFGQDREFRAYMSLQLRLWLRSMLFEKRGKDIRVLMRHFDELLPGYYKALMYGLTMHPGLTAAGCQGISRVVRTLHLRRKITRKPPPLKHRGLS